MTNQPEHEQMSRRQYMHGKAETLSRWLEGDDDEGLILETVVFRQAGTSGDAWIVEHLLEAGGPTTRIVVDSRYEQVELWSTDGPDPSVSYDYERYEMAGEPGRRWLALARDLAECYPS